MRTTTLSDEIHIMRRYGGYTLAFARRVAAERPELTWEQLRAALYANSGTCGYADEAIRRAFGR